MSTTCPSCKSAKIEAGFIRSTDIVLERATAFRKALAAPEIKASVCLDCGRIFDLRAEPEKLAKMLP